MALTAQERLKDLRVERGLTLEQLAEQTQLSKSALGSYEADDFKDISHYALIKLAKFYGVTADYTPSFNSSFMVNIFLPYRFPPKRYDLPQPFPVARSSLSTGSL